MIYTQEKTLKVAGKYIPGQIQSISVTEEGNIEDKKDKKGKTIKANQPTGYQAATVEYQIIFEESASYTRGEMVRYVQRIFKASGQKKQKKFRIVEPLANARGITEVYFNGFTTSENVGESWYTGTLTFVAPVIAAVKLTKTKKQRVAEKAAAAKAAAKKKAAEEKKKTTKKTSKSPAADTKKTGQAKAKAKKLVKKK